MNRLIGNERWKNFNPHKVENKLMTGKRRKGRRDRKIKGTKGEEF